MNWEDECYLLSKRKFRENANIINVLTKERGKVSGIVYGGNSRKIRNYLQISNKLIVFNISKNENKTGYLKTELVKPISPSYFNDKKRTSAIISLCSLLNSLLPESQPNKKIYDLFEQFLSNINLENWIYHYIFFEIDLIRELGFDTNLKTYNNLIKIDNPTKKIDLDNFKYEVPTFLIKEKMPDNISELLINKSLFFTRSILMNKFFLPNNLIFPKSRIIFENYFN
ncbi:DNA repair protein RecO [Candidatus Pelagibacter bacterium]|nr:DNA repair protein RecO [Candidatus Pelagibacter bacterium]|tara:strand:+ start:908 stop:1588 length:681 start_codon:yes stop_codon:yes gene_type:complete